MYFAIFIRQLNNGHFVMFEVLMGHMPHHGALPPASEVPWLDDLMLTTEKSVLLTQDIQFIKVCYQFVISFE